MGHVVDDFIVASAGQCVWQGGHIFGGNCGPYRNPSRCPKSMDSIEELPLRGDKGVTCCQTATVKVAVEERKAQL